MNITHQDIQSTRRKNRVRAKIKATKKGLRLCVFRSNQHISVQLIDQEQGRTLMSASDKEIKTKGKRIEIAKAVGMLIAKKALDLKISKVAFDRGKYKYHGNVKALADGAREGGLQF